MVDLVLYSLTVFCTCNEACSVRIVNNVEPTHLIIDEAAMATEPEAMIPIQLADHITLIGDHMQLQVCVFVYAYMCAYISMCMYMCCIVILCVHFPRYMCIYTCVYVCVCVCVCLYVCAYIHYICVWVLCWFMTACVCYVHVRTW